MARFIPAAGRVLGIHQAHHIQVNHIIGRKHSQKLRVIAILLFAGVPLILLALPFSHTLAALAVISHVAGALAARWLFFAEAEHVVGLYYGKR